MKKKTLLQAYIPNYVCVKADGYDDSAIAPKYLI
jgi:hypothetical protein